MSSRNSNVAKVHIKLHAAACKGAFNFRMHLSDATSDEKAVVFVSKMAPYHHIRTASQSSLTLHLNSAVNLTLWV